MVDSESRRGSLYADVLPGGYEVLDLEPPFSPARYIQALECAEKSGAGIVVIDSMSHEWEGEGGVLDMAGDNEQKSGKAGLHNWKTPKLEHAKLILRLLRSAVPVVCCIRAKFKSRQGKNEQGKTVILKDDFASPIQAEDFIFEMTVHGEIMPDHSFRATKVSHPTLGSCFPDKKPITIEHGAALAKWCESPGKPVSNANEPLKLLARELWELLRPIRGAAKDWNQCNQWLWREEILDGAIPEEAPKLSEARFREVIAKTKERLAERVPELIP